MDVRTCLIALNTANISESLSGSVELVSYFAGVYLNLILNFGTL
jgi:hypothetical protein